MELKSKADFSLQPVQKSLIFWSASTFIGSPVVLCFVRKITRHVLQSGCILLRRRMVSNGLLLGMKTTAKEAAENTPPWSHDIWEDVPLLLRVLLESMVGIHHNLRLSAYRSCPNVIFSFLFPQCAKLSLKSKED